MSDRPAPPPPGRGRHRIPLSGLSGPTYSSSWKVLTFSLPGAALVTGAVFWIASVSAEERMQQQGHVDHEVVIPPRKQFGCILVVSMSTSYHVEVQPIDGRAVMAVGQVDAGETPQMSERDLDAVLENAVTVEAGQSKSSSGPMDRGRYRWVVQNPSTTKPLRVKIKFD